MRLSLFIASGAVLLAGTAALAAGAGEAAPRPATLDIKDAVARVVVIPEDRTDVKVEVVKANAKLPLVIRTKGSRTVLDGKLDWGVGDCASAGGKPVVHVKKVGEVGWDDMPQVVIRTPRAVVLTAGGAVFGSVGRSQSLDLVNAGCGDWVVANVADKFVFSQAGSGDSRIGVVGQANVRSAGTGDIRMAGARRGLSVNIAGSGDVTVAQASGPLDVKVAGSGDVSIRSGTAESMNVTIAGSGDVDFGGRAASLKARVAGSGDVRAKAVTGVVDKRVAGSGQVKVGEVSNRNGGLTS